MYYKTVTTINRNFNFRPSKKEAADIQMIKDRITREGLGTFNRFVIEAIIEKYQRDFLSAPTYRRSTYKGEKTISSRFQKKHYAVP